MSFNAVPFLTEGYPCARNGPIVGGGQGRNRTTNTRIFSPLFHQLSCLAIVRALAREAGKECAASP